MQLLSRLKTFLFGAKSQPVSDGDSVLALAEGGFDLNQLYSDLQVASGRVDSAEAVRGILDKLVQVDTRMQSFTRGRLQEVMRQGAALLTRRDGALSEVEQKMQEIERLEGEYTEQTPEAVRLGYGRLRQQLEQAKAHQIHEKARILFYMYILLEVYKLIIKAKEERQRQVRQVEGQIEEIERFHQMEREVGALTERLAVEVSLDRQHMEETIVSISPQLAGLVQAAAKLNADLIIEAGEMILASETSLSDTGLDDQLSRLAKVVETKDELLSGIRQIETVSSLRALTEGHADLGQVNELEVRLQDGLTELGVALNNNHAPETAVLPPEWTEGLKQRYDGLPEKNRMYKGKVRTWEEVWLALPNKEVFSEGCKTLNNPTPYLINEEGQLVMGDGCAEPDENTLGKNYNDSREDETYYAYTDSEGNLQTKAGDVPRQLPVGATLVWTRGLVLENEYKAVNTGQFERDKWTWTESGKNPQVARCADWYGGGVDSGEERPEYCLGGLGSRRVLRVNLSFES